MAGHNPAVPMSFPGPRLGSFQQAVIAASPNIRIGFSPDFNGMAQVDTEVLDHLTAVLRQVEGAGAMSRKTCPDLANLERSYYRLRGMDMAITFHNMPQAVKAFQTDAADNMAFGRAMSIEDVARAQLGDRTVIFNNMGFFTRFDVLACPVGGLHAASADRGMGAPVGGRDLHGYMDWLRFAFLATTSRIAGVIGAGGARPAWLPVGIQLIGRPRGEAAVAGGNAQLFETVTGGPKTPIDPVTSGR